MRATTRRRAERTRALTLRLREGLAALDGVHSIGNAPVERCTPVTSITVAGRPLAEIERRLRDEHDVVARAGLHCSPLAHAALGTEREGTLRFSFGPFNDSADADRTVDALRAVLD